MTPAQISAANLFKETFEMVKDLSLDDMAKKWLAKDICLWHCRKMELSVDRFKKQHWKEVTEEIKNIKAV